MFFEAFAGWASVTGHPVQQRHMACRTTSSPEGLGGGGRGDSPRPWMSDARARISASTGQSCGLAAHAACKRCLR